MIYSWCTIFTNFSNPHIGSPIPKLWFAPNNDDIQEGGRSKIECYAIKLNEKGEKSVVKLEWSGLGIPKEVEIITYRDVNYYRGEWETAAEFWERIRNAAEILDRTQYTYKMDKLGIPVYEREPQ